MADEKKKVTVMEMFPEKADFDGLMDAFDKYQQEADGREIKSICEKNKEHIKSLGVNAEFLPFFLMKKLIDRAIEQVDVKEEAVNEVEEMVKNLDGGVEEEKENFEKEEVNNIQPINNDAESESQEEEITGETATGGITETESDPEADNSC
tara:strand:+ start:136 stop:588 length:453 start_codon:yes stop_codon:yes gene_type:complete